MIKRLGKLVNKCIEPSGFKFSRVPKKDTWESKVSVWQLPAGEFAEERKYWFAKMTAFYQQEYGLSVLPIQSDPAIVPPLEIVGATQFPDTSMPDAFLFNGCQKSIEYLTELRDHGCDVRQMKNILEFGVGFGRLIVHYLPFAVNLYGCDVTESTLNWTKKALGDKVRLSLTELNPPLPYESGFFDYIYAQSVFTHIPCSTAEAWIAELFRILKPGGMLIISIFDASYFFSSHSHRDFDHNWEAKGCHCYDEHLGVRMGTYLSQGHVRKMIKPFGEVLEIRSHFRDQSHVVARKAAR